MSHAEPMRNVDATWLRMDEPSNRMIISGVFLFSDTLDLETLRRRVHNSMAQVTRMRQRIRFRRLPFAAPLWEDDPEFHVDHHVTLESLADQGMTALREACSRLIAQPLDRLRPLWHMYLFDPAPKAGAALMIRVHHCYGDGVSMMQVLMRMLSPKPIVSEESKAFEMQRRNVSRKWRQSTGRKKRSGTLAAVRRFIRLSNDSKSLLKGRLTPTKTCAWTRSYPLEYIKAIAVKSKATVNDVLIAAFSGGLRQYLRGRGEEVDGMRLRAAVPVNLREEGDHRMGNYFGVVFPELPVGESDPRQRLRRVHEHMRALKGSAQAHALLGILAGLSLVPAALQRFIVSTLSKKASVVMTNVKGPSQKMYVANARLENVFFWVPQTGRLSLGVSLLSYGGNVVIGVVSDAGHISDPERLVEQIEAELEGLG